MQALVWLVGAALLAPVWSPRDARADAGDPVAGVFPDYCNNHGVTANMVGAVIVDP